MASSLNPEEKQSPGDCRSNERDTNEREDCCSNERDTNERDVAQMKKVTQMNAIHKMNVHMRAIIDCKL